MKNPGCSLVLSALLLLFPGTAQPAEPIAPDNVPLELKRRLDTLALDPQRAYQVRELRLRRDEVRVIFEEGRLIFLEPVAGQVTGALFVGEGSLIVMPQQKVERAQLARFTGVPLLDEAFTSAYLRFTEASFGELLQQIEHGSGSAIHDAELLTRWAPVVRNLNQQYSLRILTDLLIKRPRPFFGLTVTGVRLGTFDVRVDARLAEQITIGQTRWSAGEPVFDLWCSFAGRWADPAQTVRPTFLPIRYRIETRIEPTRMLAGETEIEMAAQVGGERLFALELSRPLEVKSVTDGEGQPLVWFQDGGMGEGVRRASELIAIVLPQPTEAGRHYRVRLRYAGEVIYDVGNGVLYVGARASWYPNLGMNYHADYEMTFHYPRRLVLVATGTKESESADEDWKMARWISNGPLAVAGFNLGSYEVRELRDKELAIAVYANPQLESSLQPRPLAALPPQLFPENPAQRRRSVFDLSRPVAPTPPVATAESLAREALEAIRFFEGYFGPFPYPRLNISQIPGNFGQGWPGLLYLSTFSFLRPDDQVRIGLSAHSREFFTDLVPFHETAHQWWGNLVAWESYRDQWIFESLPSYAGLLYLEKKRNDSRGMHNWLKKYKQDLLATGPDGRPLEQAGPIWLGKRLASSQMPDAYEKIVYGKGAWVMHMLRQLYRDSTGGSGSDERFPRALREFLTTYRHRTATSEDFRRILEKYMPPHLDLDETGTLEWFFDQWIFDTGIPRYKLQASIKPEGLRFQLRGKILQKDVPVTFVMPVPIYAQTPAGKLMLLGKVVVRGRETPFRFSLPWKPSKVLLDPFNTVLAVLE